MTLVIAVTGKEFVVLGADSRGTSLDSITGNRVELNMFRKIIPLNKRVSLLLHGEASAAMFLVDALRRDPKLRSLGVTAAGQALWKLGTKQIAAVPHGTRNQMPHFGILVAGIDKTGKSPAAPRCIGLSSSDSFWPHSYDRFAIKGKTMIANYLFAKEYDEEADVDGLTRLVAQSLYDTMNVDGDVGGDLTIVVIDERGTRDIPKSDLPKLIDAWGRPLMYLTAGAPSPQVIQ